MKRLLLTLLLAACVAVAAQKAEEPSPEPPPPDPVSVRFIGDGKVVLDRMGRTAAEYAAGVKNGTIVPTPLTCGLSLKITNHTRETLKVRVKGTAPSLVLDLKGKGETTTTRGSKGKERVAYADLAAGASTTIPLETLSGFKSASLTHLHPLETGDYELTATFSTFIYTPPKVGMVKAKGKGVPIGTAFKGKNPHTMTVAKTRITVTAK
ncbi:MAG: hypothetical protein K2W96_28385 [Gemmataceae bacterium]|nr:hypothetical protein [Gemmataceae bacterium]